MSIMDSQNQLVQADQLLQGLLTDFMEDNKAFEWIVVALDLIRGIRPKDLIYDALNSGKNVDIFLIHKLLFLDQMINISAAEIIQTLVWYRSHSSQKNRAIECIISGKRYEGPVYNGIVREAKCEANAIVGKMLLDLVRINQTAIEIVSREMI
jgi:hypothetical protein